MKSNQTASEVATILSDVLADLAFMFGGPEEHPLRPRPETWIECSIGYSGPVTGAIRFRCTRSFSVMLASNLLGVDPSDVDVKRKAEDAVKELVNIVCGHVVTTLHGDDAVFDLSIPRVAELADAPDWESDADDADATLYLDHQVVQIFHTLGATPEMI